MKMQETSFDLLTLSTAYAAGEFTPRDVISETLRRIDTGPENIWLSRYPRDALLRRADELTRTSPDTLPLFGIPFAVKDNIDAINLPTTAGCPAYAYEADSSAFVVDRLVRAGAIPVGKTHLDQFATGLVGTRSPNGPCANAFDPDYISGGSSSGSAVATALGQVSFALGTDTAGSGRVPAAFQNLIGLKPTRGLLSTRGVVPACRALDCVSIFALTAGDASRVFQAARSFDAADPFARPALPDPRPSAGASFRFAYPREDDLDLEDDTRALFDRAIERLENIGGMGEAIDFGAFQEAARLLYEGPYLAERFAAVGEFIERNPDDVFPVTRDIILKGREGSAVDAFRAGYRLAELKRRTDGQRSEFDFILTPTAPRHYTIAEVAADPIATNSRLGTYTNFMNLLDLSAVALPAGFRASGLPFGLTIFAGAHADLMLLDFAERFLNGKERTIGATRHAAPREEWPPAVRRIADASSAASETLPIVVCGAHMSGMALNGQLTERGATLAERTRTSSDYRFFALPGAGVERPGLIRAPDGGGSSVEVEVWDLPADRWGDFIAGIPAPLGIGSVELEDGRLVKSFLCEAWACEVEGAREITELGSWRVYQKQK